MIMDLQRELIESSKSKGGAKKGLRASAVSIALHGTLIAGVIYAGTWHLAWKSPDGGANWQARNVGVRAQFLPPDPLSHHHEIEPSKE